MDVFDQYLFDEITKSYARANLSSDDYEELYQRFLNIDYLQEVKPYLFAMRFMGYGTPSEREIVLSELKNLLDSEDAILIGLYNDLLLFEEGNNSDAINKLKEMSERGYSKVYLKEHSHLQEKKHIAEADYPSLHAAVEETEIPERIVFKNMIFEGCGYSGLYFTSGDIDYLNAKVFIEPVKATRYLSVRSQIYAGDEPFSKVFNNEYTLHPGDEWFTTQGWGNKNFNCYGNRIYQWRIELDGKDVYCQDFRFYSGKIDKNGIALKDVKLFASKAFEATEADRANFKTSFNGSELEYIYFYLSFDSPGVAKNIQIFRKITCLEDDSVVCDDYILQALNEDTIGCWNGTGYLQKGKWKRGLYKYCISFGSKIKYEGTFTVY